MVALRRRWPVILLITAFALGGTLAGSLVAGRTYRAAVTLQGPVAPGISSNDLEYADRVANTVERIAESDSLRAEVERSFPAARGRDIDVGLKAVPNTELLELTARADSAALARDAANAWAQELVRRIARQESRDSVAAQEPITNEMRALETHLIELGNALGGTVDPNRQGRLRQQIRVEELRYEALAQRAAALSLPADARTPSIVDPARATGSPWLPVARNLAIALVLGLVAGGGAALALERRSPRLDTLEEIEGAAGAPVVATIPVVRNPASTVLNAGGPVQEALGALRARLLSGSLPSAAPLGAGGHTNGLRPAVRVGSQDGELLRLKGEGLTNREIAERLNVTQSTVSRRLSRALHQLEPHVLATATANPETERAGAPARPATLLVTSARDGEGRSVVAANLAAALARARHRVLVIDADLEQPSLHRVFGLDDDAGLSELLDMPRVDGDALVSLTAPTDVENLSALTSGAESSTDLLASPQMVELLAAAKRTFEFVVIDAPALGSASGALAAATRADGVILVVGGAPVSDAVIQGARRALEGAEARIAGVVVNRWRGAPAIAGRAA